MNQLPEIKNENGIPTLYVNGEPFFALAGEIHNSSASSLTYMEQSVWPNLEEIHLNTVIVPLYWELTEPVEGEYHFELIDGLIAQAREHQMHLIILWFGLWKNSESMYVPGWMKRDTETYFRAKKVNGESINTISPFCEKAIEKDALALSSIMQHIKAVDEQDSTVIMIQVENEIGIMGAGRDYCETAERAFTEPVPEIIAQLTGKTGSWKEVYGSDAEESFMAYYFAKAIEQITKAGQKEYMLPCYANAWLKQYPWYAGSYPAGGPVKNVHKIWKATAKSLFTLAPDIYVPYVADVMEEYSYEGNPLLIPEVRKDSVTASYCLYAFAHYNAICYSPFGIEDLALNPEDVDRPPMEVMIALNIDPSSFDITGSKGYLSQVYKLLEEMKPLYLKYRGTKRLHSYLKKSDVDFGTLIAAEKYDISIGYSPQIPSQPLAAGMIYELSEDKFLIIGMQSKISFRTKEGVNKKVEILKMEEGTIVSGKWNPCRVLNGDEKIILRLGDMPSCICVEIFQY